MRLNSKVVGLIVLVVMFGGILLTTDLGWWQTEGGGRGAGNYDGTSETLPEVTVLRGSVSGYDQRGLTITTDDGQSLYIELGNSRYNRSIGFAPQVGERVTVEAFIPGGKTSYSAITVTLDTPDGRGKTYTFRDAVGSPLWVGKNAD
ncbi:MAG: hypothetical protein Q7T89_04680 [Anaerolineales bacterium]|nr:hypothetical protein [Anaerolineales bacterium]